MTEFYVKKINESFLRFDSDDNGILYEMSDYFSFYAPGFRFSPAFKNHFWDGRTRLCNLKKRTIHLGLLKKIKEFCTKRGYEFFDETENHTKSEDVSKLDDFIKSLKLPFEIRDYQREAVIHGLTNPKCVMLSPTGSGKSLIQYILVRWHYSKGRKICLIVPSISLVEQMMKDFREYSENDDSFDVDSICKPLYGKKKSDPFESEILISTWQSIKEYSSDLFEMWDSVLVDECHGAQANVLKKILESSINAPFKVGMTGSLSGEEIHEFLLTGLFGEIYQVTTTSELQKEGKLSTLKVYFVTLKHSKESVKEYYKKYGQEIVFDDGDKKRIPPSYSDELEFLVTHPKRQLFLRNIALKCKGVTLILFNRIEQGKDLFEKIKEKSGEREVFYIAGEIDAEERERIRDTIKKGNSAILVASVGTCSTGIDIPGIENVILCPSKSRIRNLQSIGRGLRIKEGKEGCIVVDISDSFSNYRNHKSFSEKHAQIRYNLYVEQKFPMKFQTLDNF